jgi:Uma2 family endonuclease
MATEATTKATAQDRGRRLYRFTWRQVLAMIAAGIIPDDTDVELWDGVLYKMTKGEHHNAIVMLVAASLRAVIPSGFHVREEKSCRAGALSLPEPDVTVCLGGMRDYIPNPPPLEKLAIVVEVCHFTRRADYEMKLSGYAARGVPVYWIVNVQERTVEVCMQPAGTGKSARYSSRTVFREGDSFPVILAGQEVARFAVADLLP